MSIKLGKTENLGNKIINEEVKSVLSLPKTDDMFKASKKLKTTEERKTYFGALKLEDFTNKEGNIQILNTTEDGERIYTHVKASDYDDVFADVNARIKTLISFNSYEGLTRKELTSMEVR